MFIIMLVVLGIMDTIYKASNKGELNKLIPLLTAIEIQETTGRVTNAEPQKTKDADKSASNVGAQSDKSTTSDPEMVEVQGDTFTMGCTSEQGDDCVSPEKPAHSVTVCPSLAQQRHPAEPEMVEVQGGTFTMGYTSEQGDDSFSNEKPAHSVTVNSFQIGKNI
ncbi:MAG: SUMF1/EgtB/PvdO family nonheme iron enzyme, partial [Prevotellaceae bacterium]|jgi:formylglycine-generating enzyme required for sulfatase activity|nr:SUMF1/EgtB/PvdO family nonheme iron enzyme [Prevotellaceae bacterium]